MAITLIPLFANHKKNVWLLDSQATLPVIEVASGCEGRHLLATHFVAMHSNVMCVWVTNAPVVKCMAHTTLILSADHLQTFIHCENIWYYVIQTQLKMISDHSLHTQKLQNFLGKHG